MSRLTLNLPTFFMFSVLIVGEICRKGLNIVKCVKVSCTLASQGNNNNDILFQREPCK